MKVVSFEFGVSKGLKSNYFLVWVEAALVDPRPLFNRFSTWAVATFALKKVKLFFDYWSLVIGDYLDIGIWLLNS